MSSEKKTTMKKELYKTELCRHYVAQKRCPYRDKCQFAHGSEELVNTVRHPKYKTQPCRSYHAKGFCTYGPRCHFVHGRTYDDSSPSKATLSKSLERSYNGRKTEAKKETTAEICVQTGKTASGRCEAELRSESKLGCSRRTDRVVRTSLEMFREISNECRRRVQGTRERWRESARHSTDEDLEERSSDLRRSKKSAAQRDEEIVAVDYSRVRREIEGVTRKLCHFQLVNVSESSTSDNLHSSPTHHHKNSSFFRAGIRPGIRQKPGSTAQSDGSANVPYDVPNSHEHRTSCYMRHSKSLNPTSAEILRQYVPPTAGIKLRNQGIRDICPSLQTETQYGGRPCSFQLSSLSNGLFDDSWWWKPPSRI